MLNKDTDTEMSEKVNLVHSYTDYCNKNNTSFKFGDRQAHIGQKWSQWSSENPKSEFQFDSNTSYFQFS